MLSVGRNKRSSDYAMHRLLENAVLLFFVLSWSGSVTAVPLNTTSTSLDIFQIENSGQLSPAVGSVVPSSFQATQVQERGGLLHEGGCFNTAIRVLSGLAHLDFKQPIGKKEWNWYGIAFGVTLSGTPPGSTTIENRFMIWGIFVAVRDMVANSDFREAVYELKWSGNTVGVLGIYNTPHLDSSGNVAFRRMTQTLFSTLPTANDTMGAANTTSSTDLSAPALLNNELEINFMREEDPRHPPQQMNPRMVFLTIISTLVFAAPHSSSDTIIRSFTLTSPGDFVQVSVEGARRKPLTRPPYFTYSRLCTALKTTSDVLLQTNYFKTFRIQMKLNSVEIGNLIFEPKSRPAVAAL